MSAKTIDDLISALNQSASAISLQQVSSAVGNIQKFPFKCEEPKGGHFRFKFKRLKLEGSNLKLVCIWGKTVYPKSADLKSNI